MRALYTKFATTLEHRFRFDAHYFLKGGFWLTFGQSVTIFLGLLTTVVFTNTLSATDFGIYKYLLGLAGIFASFSLTGLGQSLLQTSAKGFLNFYNESFKISVFYNLGVIITGLSGCIYYYLNNNMTLAIGCLAIAIFQPIINVFQFTPTILLGSRRFKESNIQQIVKILFTSAISLGALFLTENILFVFLSYLISQMVINVVISLIYYLPKTAVATPVNELKMYISYAKDTTIRTFILNLSNRLDVFLLFTQVGAVELTIYTIATVIPEQIRGFAKQLGNLLIPKYSQSNHSDVIKSLPKRSLHVFIIFCVLTILYICFAPIIYKFLFPEYIETVHLTQIFSLILLTSIVYLPHSLLLTKISQKELYVLNISGAIFQSVLFFILIPIFGVLGAIYTKILYRFIFTALTYMLCYKSK